MKAFFSVVLALCLACPPTFATASPQQTASAMPKEVLINGVELVLIPAGWFWYAVEVDKQESLKLDQRRYRDVKLWLDDFYIAKYEARARDFQRFLNAGVSTHIEQFVLGNVESCAVRPDEHGKYVLTDPNRDMPATNLSWPIADEFARWMGMRLPREVEWVKAARGTDKRIWPWGSELPDDTLANFDKSSTCQSMPVDSHPAGASPYGIVNMSGNAFELVADWYNHMHDKKLKDGMRNPPLAKTGSMLREFAAPHKILKGGRWASEAASITIAHREVTSMGGKGFLCYGTRLAMDVAEVKAALTAGKATIVRH